VTAASGLRVGLAQWRSIPGAPAPNLSTATELIERAAAAGCRLVVMPELWACGYAPATLAADVRAAAEPLDGPRGQALAALAGRHSLWLAAGSVPESAAGRIYNTAALYDPNGRLAARHRKFCLYAPGGEPDVFAAGDGPTVCDCSELGRVGLLVCFDGDFPETARALRAAGARLVIEPAAYEFAAETWWDRLYPAHALANGQWWILVNQAGGDAETGCFGRSRVVSPSGGVVAEASRASEGTVPDPELLVVDIPLGAELDDGVLFTDRPVDPVASVVSLAR
jgi:predicted amidohydrolase